MSDENLLQNLAQLIERNTQAFEEHNRLLKELIGDRQPRAKVMPLSEAWKELNYNSKDACYRRIRKGHYRVGHEVEDRRMPGSRDPLYWLDIAACRARDKVIPAKRKSA